ncbi:hypothetical protein WH47_11327 [Habropoda laboriosa]|uniref:Uncharacterized protein n=1 Tax=Habropoda laboriosa TaxID=597456 RepID=A0A0L7QLU8_9HYME|nr:hypothetical protein WH47_11327 [Habropoda laboriosa]
MQENYKNSLRLNESKFRLTTSLLTSANNLHLKIIATVRNPRGITDYLNEEECKSRRIR